MNSWLHIWLVCALAISGQLSFAQDGSSPDSRDNEVVFARMFIDAEKDLMLGNFEKAASLYVRCLELKPKNDAVYFGLGKLYLEQENYAMAEKYFEQAANLDEENKWYWLSLAQAHIAQQKFDAASSVYKKMSSRYPDDTQLAMDYANTLLYAGKERAALKVFDQIESRTGPNHETAQRKYQYFIKAEKYDKASNELERLIKVYPEDNQLYGMLAELYKATGQTKKALDVYERAHKLDPSNPYVQLSLAEFYDREGQKEKAFQYLRMAYQNPNLDVDTKVGVLIKMFGEAERFPKVRQQGAELGKVLTETHPSEAKSYSVYGDYLNLDGQFAAARTQYYKALELDPSRYAIWNQILFIDIELDDQAALLTDSEKALELFPAQPAVYLFNGIAHNHAENYEKAVKSLKMGALMVVGNKALAAQMLASLGDAYHQLGAHTSSDSAYDASLQYQPENVYVLNNYAYFLAERGVELDKAKEMSAKTLEKQPNDATYLDTYGWVLFKMEDYQDAKQFLEKAIENGGNKSAEVIAHYGDCLFMLGDQEGAMAQWKKAQMMDGENEALNDKVARGTIK